MSTIGKPETRSINFTDKVRDIRAAIELLYFLAVIAGGIAGVKAYIAYQEQNTLTAINSLYKLDEQAGVLLISNPYLQAIYAYFPEDKKGIDLAHEQICLIVDGDDFPIDWKTPSELERAIYDKNNIMGTASIKLRKAEYYCEIVLYMLTVAEQHKRAERIDKNEYKTWEAAIYDIGGHPLFLMCVAYWHKQGYMEEMFAKELQSIYRRSDELSAAAKYFYPEIVESDKWPSRVGHAVKNKSLLTQWLHYRR